MQTKPYLQKKLIPIVLVGLGSSNEQLNEAVKRMFEEDLVDISELNTSMSVNLTDKKIEYASADGFTIRLNETKEKQFQRIFEAWAFEAISCKEFTPDMEVLFVEPDEQGDMVDAWIVRVVGPTYFDGNAAQMVPPTEAMVENNSHYRPSAIAMSFAGRITTGYPIMERVMPVYQQYRNNQQEASEPVPIKRTPRAKGPSAKVRAGLEETAKLVDAAAETKPKRNRAVKVKAA